MGNFLLIIIFVLIGGYMLYYNSTTPLGEYTTITEKISEVGENCSLYKTYQFCEENVRCAGIQTMERAVYSTICENGQIKTEEHIRVNCGKNCTKTFTEEVTTTHKLNP